MVMEINNMSAEAGLAVTGFKALSYIVTTVIGLVGGLLGGSFRAGVYKNKIIVLEDGQAKLEQRVEENKEKSDVKLEAHMLRIQDKLEDMKEDAAERHVTLVEKISLLVK